MSQKLVFLLCGVEKPVDKRIRAICDKVTFKTIETSDQFADELDKLSAEEISLICCGPAIADLAPIEMAQSLKSSLQGCPLMFIASEKYGADDKTLFKNGFDKSFFLPLDGELLDKSLIKIQAELLGEDQASFLSVPLDELKEGAAIDFDVMVLLPLNKKYVRIFKKGTVVRPEVIAKLKSQSNNVVFIKVNEEAQFRNYIKLKSLANSNGETCFDRKERMHSQVRGIFHSLIAPDAGSFDGGKALLSDAQNIVSQLVKTDSISNVLESMFKQTGQALGDFYDQSLRVSTYASMFSLIIKEGMPEDLAVAGLFYHVGLAKCPEEIVKKQLSELTNEERAIFYRHPEDSVSMAKEKKIILVPEAINAILHHHEKLDGTGYPKQLRGGKLCRDSILLALADEFDALTSISSGRQKLSAEQALIELEKKTTGEGEVARKLRKSLQQKAQKAS